ncbi:MAG TPA: DUF2252 family protein, partial [Bacteroidales bacterium]|nr:DUF2252 family protein [Bacteroidales bacterium]
MSTILTPLTSRADRYASGKRLRQSCPRNSHSAWKPPADRPDPVQLVLSAGEGRLQELLPLRHGRMAQSPFTFYRGSALNMASDLAATPSTGIRVQCCGDAHLMNFGGFATPERNVIFSINDLDETLPAPWEWDIKRLAASFMLACRDNGLSESVAREVVLACIRSYREHMAGFGEMKTLELWYYCLDSDMLISSIKDPRMRKRGIQRLAKERGRSVAEDIFPKLTQASGESHIIKDQLPEIFHAEGHQPGEIDEVVSEAFDRYKESLLPAYQSLLDRFVMRDAAIK